MHIIPINVYNLFNDFIFTTFAIVYMYLCLSFGYLHTYYIVSYVSHISIIVSPKTKVVRYTVCNQLKQIVHTLS